MSEQEDFYVNNNLFVKNLNVQIVLWVIGIGIMA